MRLTVDQRRALQIVERTGASLSLVGVCLIFVTFAAFKRLRTVPNTFILCASIANVGASAACVIGYEGLNAGFDSVLCQVQAFLLEFFMQSDPWWSLSMAINVWMVFFMAANPASFRRYLWIYCLVCYGGPALPAIVLLLIRGDPRGPVYGNATMWCWIGDSWNSLRIYTCFLQIWVCILLSTIIYFAVGYHVFHQRNQLRNLTLSNPARDTSTSDGRNSGERVSPVSSRILSPFSAPMTTATDEGQPCYYGMVTTEVRVTTEASWTSEDHNTPPTTPSPSIVPFPPCKPATHHGDYPWARPAVDYVHQHHSLDVPNDDFDLDLEPGVAPERSHSQRSRENTTSISTNPMPLGQYTTISTNYTRPTTIRRQPPSTRSWPSRLRSWPSRIRSGTRHFLTKLRNLDPVKLAYLRTSSIFAISILITWTPSSINRVYTLVHPSRFHFGLNMASAVVLPLQGVWNCVIYCATSWYVLVEEVADLRVRLLGESKKKRSVSGLSAGFNGYKGGRRRGPRERRPDSRVSTIRVTRYGSL
ncbi:G-protein coupled receptor [Coniochaeta sp. 2T2.1]|nr:G-protein coupled receptor [Coniochaeta sp. 2T2.1]